MQNKLPLPIGASNYKLVSTEYYYVDKTLLIKELLDERAVITLFTRPRRFGKTLNMDMLRTFFEKTPEDTSKYFKDKKIWQAGEKYTSQQGKYPVIFLSLKDANKDNWQDLYSRLKATITDEFLRHKELKKSTRLSNTAFYEKIIAGTGNTTDYATSLLRLSQMLHEHYRQQPIIIIDEYDTPIQAGYINGFYEQAIQFIRDLFSSALKDNPHIAFGFLTGILRVAKESIFSGLNNINVNSLLERRYSDYFGFTTEEVQAMATYYQADDKMSELQEWYDGYKFGNTEIYNPWSVLKYFNNYCEAEPYWVQTSENSTIREIIKGLDTSICENLRALLNGSAVESIVDTSIIYPKLKEQQTNIFGFLLMTGYLKSIKTTRANGICLCELSIPNKEIQSVYSQEIVALLADKIDSTAINLLQQYLITKNGPALQNVLKKFLLETVSYYDTLKENYYQGLLLGMTGLFTNTYYVSSNRESGEGRYDIQLQPKTAAMPGIIIEIKTAKDATEEQLKALAAEALAQIESKHYDTELMAHGITTVYKYGIAFSGKKVEIATN